MNTTTNTRGVSPCPECGGAGVYPKIAIAPPPPDVTCRKCHGSGRDYHALSAQNTRGVSEAMVDGPALLQIARDVGLREVMFNVSAERATPLLQAFFSAALEAALSAPEPAAQGEADAPSIEAAEAMGAKGGPAVEAERLAFEAWMKGHCWTLNATWRDGAYRSDAEQDGKLCPHAMQTRGLWAAWRDRAALAAPPAQPAELAAEYTRGRCDGWEAAKAVQPAERVPPAKAEMDYEYDEEGLLDTYSTGHMDGWNDCRKAMLASPAPSEGGKGVEG